MPPVSLTDVTRITERLYKRGIHRIGLGKKTPLWSVMPKFADFYEETYTLRNRHGLNPSGSATFQSARDGAGASPYGAFALTRVRDYINIQINNETMEALSRDMERLVSYVKEECDSGFEKAARRVNHNLYRDHGGAIFQLLAAAAGGNTNTITVRNPETLINVFRGMRLVSSNTDGTSGAVDANATVVSALNRRTGTITTAAASWDVVTGWSDGDYGFPEGDFGLKLAGLNRWLPPTDPTDTLFGQPRIEDPTYLGGVRYTAQSGAPDGSIVRTLINAAAYGQRFGAEPSHVFMHPEDYGYFLNETNQKVQYPVPAHVGFKDPTNKVPIMIDVGIVGVTVMLPTGPAIVVPDPDCQKNVFWMLDMRTWGYYGLNNTGPKWLVPDGGQRFVRMTYDNLDASEATLGWYGQVGCSAPGCNIRVDATLVL